MTARASSARPSSASFAARAAILATPSTRPSARPSAKPSAMASARASSNRSPTVITEPTHSLSSLAAETAASMALISSSSGATAPFRIYSSRFRRPSLGAMAPAQAFSTTHVEPVWADRAEFSRQSTRPNMKLLDMGIRLVMAAPFSSAAVPVSGLGAPQPRFHLS